MEDTSFSHVEKTIDTFLKNFALQNYVYLNVLYRFEETDIDINVFYLVH